MSRKLITDEVVDACIDMLARRWLKSAIKGELKKRFGIDAFRTVEAALARAREKLRINASRPLAEVLADTIRFYESVIASPEVAVIRQVDEKPNEDSPGGVTKHATVTRIRGVTTRDKLAAQERLAALLGLENAGTGEKPPIMRRAIGRTPAPTNMLREPTEESGEP